MEHSLKLGKALNDSGTKFVKKILKKKGIVIQGRFQRDNDCEIRITNIRKYQNIYYNNFTGVNLKFVYEVDIVVKLIGDEYRFYDCNNKRGTYWCNKRIRGYVNETNIKNELVYFNINDIVVSKITFEK